jgi:hypothetical protein
MGSPNHSASSSSPKAIAHLDSNSDDPSFRIGNTRRFKKGKVSRLSRARNATGCAVVRRKMWA